tara:strand:- start:954 stop:1199 length:246 start_codon:yes stop_codon:yes gene_type:complete
VRARVHITLKSGVLDPQGKAIHNALKSLGFDNVHDVRQGKYLELDLSESNVEQAQASVEDMCTRLLANTVIEDYKIELEDD